MKILLVCLLSSFLLLSACQKETPTGPTDTTTPPQATAVVVGPAGGAVSCEGFTLVVPPAAFSSQETLSVKQEQYDGMFGTSNVSGLYKLEGLPLTFAGNLQVRLKCTGAPSGTPTFFLGTRAREMETRQWTVLYKPVAATLDSGYLKVSLSAANSMGKVTGLTGGGLDAVKWFIGINDRDSLMSSGRHFELFFPRYAVGMATLLAQDLEDAYLAFEQMGMNRGIYARAEWPFVVSYLDYKADASSYIWVPLSRENLGPGSRLYMTLYCDIVKAAPANATHYRARAFGAFSRLFELDTDPFFRESDSFFSEHTPPKFDCDWYHTAFATWAGAWFVPASATPCPLRLMGQKLVPLDGMSLRPRDYKIEQHGWGMVGLLKHIADTYGTGPLADIYFELPRVNSAIDAFLAKVPEPENVWWPAFMKRYLSGEIFGVAADTLLRETEKEPGKRTFTVAGKDDTVKYFTAQYRDLSAKLFRVNLDYSELSPTSTIRFSIDPRGVNLDYADVLLFGLKDHKLEYWTMGDDLTVTKLKELTAAGYDIIAAVVNSANEPPYADSMSIDLDVRISSEVLTYARIKVRTAGVIEYNDGSTSATNFVLYNSDQKFRQGTLLNGVFTTRWDTTTTVRHSGNWTIQVDFSQTPSRVVYFKAEETTVSYDTETWRVESSPTCSITGGKDQYGRYFYRIQGPEVAKHLLPVYNRLDGSFGYWRELKSTTFDADSYIEIILE